MQNPFLQITAIWLTRLFRIIERLFSHASSDRKVNHPWLPADKFDVIPEDKIHNIPCQEILGDIRPILWPEKYIKNGKGVARRDPRTGRFVSLKKKQS